MSIILKNGRRLFVIKQTFSLPLTLNWLGLVQKHFVPKFWKFVPNPKITSIDSNSAFTTVATCHNTNIFSSFKFELNWILYKKILYQTFMCWVVHLQNYTGLAVFVPPGYNYLYPTHLYQSTQYLETNLLLPLKLVQIFHHKSTNNPVVKAEGRRPETLITGLFVLSIPGTATWQTYNPSLIKFEPLVDPAPRKPKNMFVHQKFPK